MKLGVRTTQGHVHNVGRPGIGGLILLLVEEPGGIEHPLHHRPGGTPARGVKHLHGQQFHFPHDAGHTLFVIGRRTDGSRHMGTVPVAILDVVILREVPGVFQIDFRLQIGVIWIDARVDHGDAHTWVAGGYRPGLGQANLIVVPPLILGIERIIGGFDGLERDVVVEVGSNKPVELPENLQVFLPA